MPDIMTNKKFINGKTCVPGTPANLDLKLKLLENNVVPKDLSKLNELIRATTDNDYIYLYDAEARVAYKWKINNIKADIEKNLINKLYFKYNELANSYMIVDPVNYDFYYCQKSAEEPEDSLFYNILAQILTDYNLQLFDCYDPITGAKKFINGENNEQLLITIIAQISEFNNTPVQRTLNRTDSFVYNDITKEETEKYIALINDNVQLILVYWKAEDNN